MGHQGGGRWYRRHGAEAEVGYPVAMAEATMVEAEVDYSAVMAEAEAEYPAAMVEAEAEYPAAMADVARVLARQIGRASCQYS